MTIEFRCDGCHSLLRTSDDKAGRRAKCPHCGATVTTPAPPHDADFEDYGDHEEPDEFSRYFGGGDSTYAQPRPRTHPAAPPAPSTGRRVPCPMCGEPVAAAALRCRFCGETLDDTLSPRSRRYTPTAGSSVASLVLGIIGLMTFCVWFITLPCSALAVGLGITGILASRSGRYQGEGMAIAGLVLGILGVLFGGLVLAAIGPINW